jgi:BatD DUF11 like domain
MAMTKTRTIYRNGSPLEAGIVHLQGLKRLLAVAFCMLAGFAVHAASFTASLDRETVSLGESATMSLIFNGGQPENLNMPNVPGLQITKIGYSFNNSIDTSGQANSTMTVTFSVTPQQVGNFTIPAMTAAVGGQQVSSQPLTLSVQKLQAPSAAQINSGSQIAFMRFLLPDKKVYPGEVLTGQLQIFFRDDVQHSDAFEINDKPADGFVMGKIMSGQQQNAQIGDHSYTVVPLSVVLTVTKAGTVSLGPITASVTILTGAQQSFFGLAGGQQQRISMTADAVSTQSLPLPAENVPASFNGMVGDYSMNVTAGPTNVAVGDPITLRVQISGRGPLDSLTLPNQAGWNDFKIFSPTSKVQLNDQLGTSGTKTFEEIVTPENVHTHTLPALSFSFFNPDDGNYHTLTQPAMPLSVTAAGATPLPTIAAAKQPENQTPQDIVPIRQNLGTLMHTSTPFVMRPAFLALQSIPVLAFFAALVWRKRTDNLANNPRLRRKRAVEQLIAGGLNDLNKFAAENKSNEFFAVLFRLLQELLGERLDCPATSITEEDAETRLASLGAKPETLESLRELFQACNQARYAPIQTSQELSALATKFKKAAGELQELKI